MNSSPKNDICVFTVVYPCIEEWIPQFRESLLKQSLKDFDLVIVNDGLDLEKLKLFSNLFNCKILPSKGSIAENRNTGFSGLLKSGYRYVIFTDLDDLMAENRVSVSRELLDKYDIVVNDLSIIDSKGGHILDQYLSSRLGNFKRIHANEILDYNYMGLGNSSVRVEILKNITIPKDIEVVDWYLFTLLLNRGHSAIFTSSTTTLYRQHNSNIIGFHQPAEDNINFLAEHKYQHYLCLQKLSEYHQNRSKEFSKLIKKLKNPIYKKKYLEKLIDQMPEYPFWFESIKPD